MFAQVIANLHRPIYTTSISGVSQSSDLQGGADQRAAFEDLFFTYQVQSLNPKKPSSPTLPTTLKQPLHSIILISLTGHHIGQ